MSLEEDLYSLELQTLDGKVRSDPRLMGQLLSEEFSEFGASGKQWSRSDVLRMLKSQGSLGETRVEGFKVTQLGDENALLTYSLITLNEGVANTSIRSSVWKRTNLSWQMLFHQGTTVRD